MMEPIGSIGGVTLVAPTTDSNVWVRADRLRLRQILLNLISNGIKYNRRGGHVWVECDNIRESVSIAVRDDGPGISSELQSRLFSPFDRLGAEVGSIEGTGIGLSLTRSLVELMGGSISVRSTPGLGSNFTITLPLQTNATTFDDRAAKAECRDESHDGEVGLMHSATVLYIEDNLLNVYLVEDILKLRPNWKLLHASLGQLGIDMAHAHLPDLIILDSHLPDFSGRDVLTTLKHDPATSSIPVLILTADASVRQRTLLLELGANCFLTKPLDLEELLTLLDAAATNRSNRD
jgi:CheY-like chemotaxis protein